MRRSASHEPTGNLDSRSATGAQEFGRFNPFMVLMVNTLITPSELIEWFRCLLSETGTERRKKAPEERDKLKISVVRPGELGPGEIAAWLSMQRQTPALANPFLCPDFTLAVGALRSCARVAVLHDGPQLAGFFPFERRGLSVGVPIGHGLNQRQGLIHAPGAEWDPKALLRACRLSAWQFDNLVADQPHLGRFATEVVPVAAVDLAHGFAHYEEELQQKSGKFYREIKRKTRRLEEEVGKVHFVADSRDKTALDSLVNWKSEQLRQKGSLDIFTRPWITGLLDQLFSIKADHFSMPLSLLAGADATHRDVQGRRRRGRAADRHGHGNGDVQANAEDARRVRRGRHGGGQPDPRGCAPGPRRRHALGTRAGQALPAAVPGRRPGTQANRPDRVTSAPGAGVTGAG
jgi:hypothetical protein